MNTINECTIMCAGCGKIIPSTYPFECDSLCEECETEVMQDVPSWCQNKETGDQNNDKKMV